MCLRSLLFILALCSLKLVSHAFPLKPQPHSKQLPVRRRVAYSVVAVDGGSDATASAGSVTDIFTLIHTSDSIKTVTAPASSTPPSLKTIVVTNFVSEPEPEKTVFISLIQESTPSMSPTATPSNSMIDLTATSASLSTVPLTSYTSNIFSSGNCVNATSTSQSITPTSLFWSYTPTAAVPLESSTGTKGPEASGSEVAVNISTFPTPTPSMTESSAFPTSSTKTYNDGRWHTSFPFWNATLTMLSSASTTAVSTGRANLPWGMG